MSLKKEYDSLYQHWLKEIDEIDLLKLNDEDLSNYRKNLDAIQGFTENSYDPPKVELIKAFKDSFSFLLEDLMKVREVKIMNAALNLQEIELNRLIEPEKLLYQNLVSVIKGFRSVRALAISDSIKIAESPPTPLKGEESIEPSKLITESLKSSEKEIESTEKNNIQDGLNYVLVRFLKKTPPLEGMDLIKYGPFEKEDLARLPERHANILILGKFAEKIEFS